MEHLAGSERAVTRRDFLKAGGLAFGALVGAGLACSRRGPTSAPAAKATIAFQPSPTALPVAMNTATSPPPTLIPLPPEQAADLVLLNGKIITVDAADTIAQAVAVRDGRIQAVGTTDQMQALVGPATQTLDLGGRAVTPGLIDAHNHLQVMGLMNTYYVSFVPPEVRNLNDLRAKLRDLAAKTPEGEWIQGYFLVVEEGRLPNRQDLDPASPRHPVWILQQGGHYGSANSLALQMAGISAATPNPEGGVIEKDTQGEPTGVFYNHRAMDLLRRNIPPYTPEMVRDNIISTQPLLAACGVTSFHDNNVRGVDVVSAYQQVGKDGGMLLRGAIYYTLEWPKDMDRALKEIKYGGDESMRFAGFKFLLDGQSQMAFCHQPHNGVRWDLPTWEPKSLKQAVRALHDTGLQISVHCIGDAAVDLTLDAYEEAMNANPRPDPRHRIEHCILSTPQATQRMKDLGVVVCTQPQFLRMTQDGWGTVFGPERARRAIVTREWLEGGVHLALGSDAPTTPWYTPQVTLHGAVSRVTATNQQHEPGQALTIQEALRAHTLGAAYAGHEETTNGSIEMGKLADLAVWGEDPYTAPTSQLWKLPIDMTLVGGQVVYPQ